MARENPLECGFLQYKYPHLSSPSRFTTEGDLDSTARQRHSPITCPLPSLCWAELQQSCPSGGGSLEPFSYVTLFWWLVTLQTANWQVQENPGALLALLRVLASSRQRRKRPIPRFHLRRQHRWLCSNLI